MWPSAWLGNRHHSTLSSCPTRQVAENYPEGCGTRRYQPGLADQDATLGRQSAGAADGHINELELIGDRLRVSRYETTPYLSWPWHRRRLYHPPDLRNDAQSGFQAEAQACWPMDLMGCRVCPGTLRGLSAGAMAVRSILAPASALRPCLSAFGGYYRQFLDQFRMASGMRSDAPPPLVYMICH